MLVTPSGNLAIDNNRNNVELWAKKANLLTQLDRPDEADEAYEQASLLQPKNQNSRLSKVIYLKNLVIMKVQSLLMIKHLN